MSRAGKFWDLYASPKKKEQPSCAEAVPEPIGRVPGGDNVIEKLESVVHGERDWKEEMRWFNKVQKSLQRKINERYLCMYVCACDEVTWRLDALDVWGTMELLLEMAGVC